MKNLTWIGLSLIVFLIPDLLFGQNSEWDTWDSKYKEVDITLLLGREQKYSDSVNNDPNAVKLYMRQDGYRFKGIFTGEWRDLTDDRREVMKTTFKLFSGQNAIFDQTKKEVQIRINDQLMWMPIQPILEKPFKKEIMKDGEVYLYTLFFNHHKQEGTLYNIFFISEFRQR